MGSRFLMGLLRQEHNASAGRSQSNSLPFEATITQRFPVTLATP